MLDVLRGSNWSLTQRHAEREQPTRFLVGRGHRGLRVQCYRPIELVARAEVIIRAGAERQLAAPARNEGLREIPTRVHFTVLSPLRVSLDK